MFRRAVRFIGNMLIGAAFVAGVSTPGVIMLLRTEAPATAATENRVLASRPGWSWDRTAIVIQEMVERTIPQLYFNPPEILPQRSQPVQRSPLAARPQTTNTR